VKAGRRRKIWVVVSIVAFAFLAAMVVAVGSLRVPVYSDDSGQGVVFFALNMLLGVTFGVFFLILLRTLLRLSAERSGGQLGARFKWKMLAGAMGLSLLPVIFMFYFGYALVNRTMNLWFPRPLELANEQSQSLLDELVTAGSTRRMQEAKAACELAQKPGASLASVTRDAAPDADAIWFYGPGTGGPKPTFLNAALFADKNNLHLIRTLSTDAEVWTGTRGSYIGGSTACAGGTLVVARAAPQNFLASYQDIKDKTAAYTQQKQNLRAYKRTILFAFLLTTLVLIFATTWTALFLSKQVTGPIQALADGTAEVSRGNFDYRIQLHARDELGMLMRSFNRMTEQLGEGRRQINEFTQSLEHAVEERERRRKLMETILENVPTGVISLNEAGEISRMNSATASILGDYARGARALDDLLGEEAARAVLHLMRRSLRMGAASREIEIAAGGRLVRAAVTVSSLGPRRSNPGFIVVIDDLTELLRAQKAAAWQEVAQRIAHEIKNPLTPIQLSAQRLLRQLEKISATRNGGEKTEFERLAAECAGLIEREVQTLASLVEEFSQFARFPAARLVQADTNTIVASAMRMFQDRLDGITVETQFAEGLPLIKADEELLRRVLANLIDNAAEAMEGATIRKLRVATRGQSDGDAVEIEIADSGHGISPQDKERLFLPHFSTKERGTGLGLAIASRIVAEHNGTIRAEDNLPMGARFLIRFPAMEVAAQV
jgi:two-component system nitrogen regulation sensor histidine kinase NtrY